LTTLLVPWLAFPAVLAGLSLGCGLLLERVSGERLPRPLVVPCGFAVVILVAQLAVTTDVTAELAMPAVVVAALAGFALAWPWRRPALDGWPVLAAVGALAAYAAPIVLSGSPTFAGYIKLDDDSTLLALLDRAMEHGRSLAGLEPSTYQRVLDVLLDEGYPLGSLMPIGVGREIVRGDAMWLYQPAMAFMAAMLALGLYELAGRIVATRWLRAAIAIVAAQSALLYGYALWGGIKELGTSWTLPLLVALVPAAIRAQKPLALLPLAAVTAVLFGVLNLGALVWLAPALGYALLMMVRERGVHATLRPAGTFVGLVALLSLPTIVVAPAFLSSNIVSFDPLANLIAPLNPLQMAGIWPAGDFRFDPDREAVTRVLIAVALVAAAITVVWALRRRIAEVPLYVLGSLASAVTLWIVSTPWIEAKAFATAAPAVPFAALLGAAVVARSGRLIEATVLGVVVAGGVLWSNVLQYHDAWLAPRDQLAELSVIGERFAGDAPALMTEYQPYGARHFLRRLDPEAASELRARQVALRNGRLLDKGEYANLDEFADDAVGVYRTLVLRRSPLESRPPSDYVLRWEGRWYEVWQHSEPQRTTIREHLPLGGEDGPGSIPECREVVRLASVAGPGGRLAAAVRTPVVVAGLPGGSRPSGGGTTTMSVSVPRAGSYEIWLGGSFRDRIDLHVDGRQVGSRRNRLDHDGQYTSFGVTALTPGTHTVSLRYSGPDLHPGSGGVQFPIGPLVLSTATAADVPVTVVPAARARELCGKRLDWIEALPG
jgi:hypothetical protein